MPPESARLAMEVAGGCDTIIQRPDVRQDMCRAAHLAGQAINISKTTASHALSYSITSEYGDPSRNRSRCDPQSYAGIQCTGFRARLCRSSWPRTCTYTNWAHPGAAGRQHRCSRMRQNRESDFCKRAVRTHCHSLGITADAQHTSAREPGRRPSTVQQSAVCNFGIVVRITLQVNL